MVIINDYLLENHLGKLSFTNVDTKEKLSIEELTIDLYNNISVNFKDNDDLSNLGILVTFINNSDVNANIDLTISNSDELLLSIYSLKFYSDVINALKFNTVEVVLDDKNKKEWLKAVLCTINNSSVSSIDVYNRINSGLVLEDKTTTTYKFNSFDVLLKNISEEEDIKIIGGIDIIMKEPLNNYTIIELYDTLKNYSIFVNSVIREIRLFADNIEKFSLDKNEKEMYNEICNIVNVVYTSNSSATTRTVLDKNKKEIYYNI